MEKELKITLTQKEFEELRDIVISKYDKFLTKKKNMYVCHLTDNVVDYDNRIEMLTDYCNFYDNLLKKFLIKGE